MIYSVGVRMPDTPCIGSLNDVPEELYENIYFVDLRNKELTKVPDKIFNFVNLEILDISFNNINLLPKKISKFKKLRMLCIQNNPINIPTKMVEFLANLDIFTCNHHMLFNDNIMIVNWYDNKVEIFDNIDTLIVNQFKYNTSFDNLPQHLKYLKISGNKSKKISLENLPCSLETLILKNVNVLYNNLKIPFGCNLYIN